MDRKPKIAVIGLKGLPAFGGAATVGENLMKQLKHEFSFYVYSVESHASEKGFNELGGYYQIVFKSFIIKKLNIFIYYIKSALHALLYANYNIIHLHHIDGAFILPILRLRYKVICTSHARPQMAEKWPEYVKLLFSFNEKLVLRRANIITTVALPLQEYYKNNANRIIHYIPNGIDGSLIPSNENIQFSNYLLFAAGRIIPLKGLHLLLNSLKSINYEGKLLVLGDLNQMASYKKQILGMSHRLDVTFLGLERNKRKMLKYVQNAKLFVFPSYSENMSIMLLEVASMKTPLICSDIAENRAVFDESEALFFKSGSEQDLSFKLQHALLNRQEMIMKASKAYNKLNQHFTWQNISKEYTILYQNLIKQ